MDSLLKLLTFDIMVITVAVVFLCVIIAAVIKFMRLGDSPDRGLQKIIGGLCVFLVAIISRDPWVFSLSIFVGGLIIASEDFMLFLAAILKSTGSDVSKVISNYKVSVASQEAIDEKIQYEIVDFGDFRDANLKTLRRSEESVSEYFANRFGLYYQKDLSIQTAAGNLVADGALIMEPDKVHKLIEIKYFTSTDINAIANGIKKFLDLINSKEITLPLIIALVFNDVSIDQAMILDKDLKNRLPLANLDFAFFKLTNEGVEPVSLPSIGIIDQ